MHSHPACYATTTTTTKVPPCRAASVLARLSCLRQHLPLCKHGPVLPRRRADGHHPSTTVLLRTSRTAAAQLALQPRPFRTAGAPRPRGRVSDRPRRRRPEPLNSPCALTHTALSTSLSPLLHSFSHLVFYPAECAGQCSAAYHGFL